MTWLDQWLAETDTTTCPLCPHPLESSTHAVFTGDKQLVPNLSPNLSPAVVAPPKMDRGQGDKSTCPQLLPPAKPAPVLRLQPLGTKGQKGQAPGRDQQPATPIQDPIMEALCLGLPAEEARDMREERAGILEYLGGMSRPIAEGRAGLPVRGPPDRSRRPWRSRISNPT